MPFVRFLLSRLAIVHPCALPEYLLHCSHLALERLLLEKDQIHSNHLVLGFRRFLHR